MSKAYYVPLVDDITKWKRNCKYIFWDESFLQDKDEEFLSNADYEVLEASKINAIARECITEHRLKIGEVLSQELNKYHGENFPQWYWDNILQMWLNDYIYTVLEKCSKIEYIQERDCIFQVLNYGNRNVYSDVDSFMNDSYKRDNNFQQIFSDLLDLYDVKHIERLDITPQKFTIEYNNTSFLKKISIAFRNSKNMVNFLKRACVKLYGNINSYIHKNDARILMYETDWQLETRNELTKKSNNKIMFCDMKIAYQDNCRVDGDFRDYVANKLIERIKPQNDGVAFMLRLLPQYIPFCYIEDYKNIVSQISPIFFSKDIKAIFSVTGLLHFPMVLTAMRAKAMNGTKIMAMQHGGNYGIQKYIGWFEREVADVYYTWGNYEMDEDDLSIADIRVAPSGKFKEHKKVRKNPNGHVLFGGTCIERHPNMAEAMSGIRGMKYIDRQIKILKMLNPDILKNITIRNHNNECGWHINDRICQIFPDINFASSYGQYGFIEDLKQCSLYLVDHMYTTWIEALLINKPFIIVMDVNAYVCNKAELPYIKKMIGAGIIRDIDSVGEINDICSDIDSWWNEPERQAVVKIIRDRYLTLSGMSEDKMVEWWLKELMAQADAQ